MWKSLILLAVLANLFITVSSAKGNLKDKHTIITTITSANSTADANADSGNGSQSLGLNAGASASVTTIVKTHLHSIKKCAIHEKYVKCPAKLCQPQVCEHVGFPLCARERILRRGKSLRISHEADQDAKECHGPPACVCIDDYVRNDEGVCIPVTDCPSCGGDNNATFGCGINCGRRCSNYMNKDVSCPDSDICYMNSCDCKEDYVFDDYTGKCVLPDDCSNKNVPDPEDSEGTPGNGEPGEEGEGSCDNCNGDCQPDDMDSEGGRNQCSTGSPIGQTTADGPDEAGSDEEGGNEEENEGDGNNENMNSTTESANETTDETETEDSGMESSSAQPGEDGEDGGEEEMCLGDPNAKPGCDRECKKRCPGNKPKNCRCPERSCECKEGYVYNPATNQCVKPNKCGPGKGTEGPEGSTMSPPANGQSTTTESPCKAIKRKTTTATPGEDMTSEDPDTEESESTSEESAMTSSSGMQSTTKKRNKTKKPRTTTAMPGEGMTSEDPDMGESESTSEGSEMTSSSGMKSTTKKGSKTKKPRTTTAMPGEGMTSQDPDTEESESTSEESEMTSSSGMESTTKKVNKTKKPRTTTATPGESMTSEDPDMGESESTSEGSEMTSSSGMKSTTKKGSKTKKPRTTTAMPGEGMTSEDPDTEESESTSEESEMTSSSGMESTTKKVNKTKKPRTTTATPGEAMTSEDPDTEESESTSEGSEMTSSSGMKSTTKKGSKTKKPRTTTAVPGEGMTSEDPDTQESESTSEESVMTSSSGIDSTTKKGNKTKKPRTTTVTPGENMTSEDPETEESESTSEGSEMTSTSMRDRKTKKPKTTTPAGEDMTSGGATNMPGMGTSTMQGKKTTMSGSGGEFHRTTRPTASQSTTEASENQLSTGASRKPRTTTMNVADGMSTTNKPKRRRRTRKPRTTDSGEESASTMATPGSDSGTTGSGTNETDKCKGNNERYYECATACPEYTCRDYLNSKTTKCNRRSSSSSNCKPGCRCRNGAYRSSNGKCLTGAQCRRRRRRTTPSDGQTGASGMPATTEMATTTQESETCQEEALQLFVKANLGFTAKILVELSLLNAGQNVLCGGSSLLFLLAQIGLFSSGPSLVQIQAALGLNTEQIRCLLPALYANLTIDLPGIDFDLMCNVVADNSCPLTDEFKDTIEDVFQNKPLNLDLSDVLSATSLSDTVSSVTGLLNFVTSEVLSLLNSLILVDAQVFIGEWQKKFDPTLTVELDFNGPNGVIKKPMMYQYGRFLYVESSLLGCRILKLKYRGGDFCLVIFLPNDDDGILDLVNKLVQVDSVELALNSMRLVNLEIYLPKFKATSSNRLKQPVIKANVDAIFNGNTAGLLDVVNCEAPLVSDILQMVSISIDETGNGKPSSSSSGSTTPANPRQQRANTFKANRPFVYYLMRDDIVIFAGIYLL